VASSSELLDPGPDVDHYARHLYEWLRDADRAGVETLVVVPPRQSAWAGRSGPPPQGRRPSPLSA
jgi:hypothetical protein